jgi:hypothetical protein
LALTGFLIYSGEAMPLSMVVQMQMGEEPVLYRPRYGNRDLQFKLLATNTRQPDIVAVGSSRILQFRSIFFNRNTRVFYNAAGPAWQLEHVAALVEGLEYTPRILIISLDQPWFNDAYPGDPFQPSLEPTSDFDQIFMVNRSVIQSAGTGLWRDGIGSARHPRRARIPQRWQRAIWRFFRRALPVSRK